MKFGVTLLVRVYYFYRNSVIREPLEHQEGNEKLHTEADLNGAVGSKYALNCADHYNKPEIAVPHFQKYFDGVEL